MTRAMGPIRVHNSADNHFKNHWFWRNTCSCYCYRDTEWKCLHRKQQSTLSWTDN